MSEEIKNKIEFIIIKNFFRGDKELVCEIDSIHISNTISDLLEKFEISERI
jgi:hypothetical protein